MSNIEWLVNYEREGTKLDFKKEQYQKEKYHDLIKDIMSMANSPVDGKKYIIVGVKDKPDGTKEYYSVPKDEFIDQATYQQVIRENVEPTIDFSYYPLEMEGITLGVFEIDNCINPPYMMKKDYKGLLKKGECFVRKGSQQERMTRRDLDEIYQHKSKVMFNGKITIGFNKNLEQKLTIEGKRNPKSPSQEAKEEIESILTKRKVDQTFGITHPLERLGYLTDVHNMFASTPYEKRKTDVLEKNLKEVRDTYFAHDWYYYGEEMSEKLNLTIRNDGDQYLEDVSIVLEIPSKSFVVMEKIYNKPQSGFMVLPSTMTFDYPNVIKEEDKYVVEVKIGDLRHKQNTVAFNDELRVYFGPKSLNQCYKWSYTIFAKNLPNPISGELTVEVT